jgi:predicted glycogen debranching enzyme
MLIGKEKCQDCDRALSLEWLETNGCGGFAIGTVAGANTRRYHGLLVVATPSENHRYVLVNHLEEWLHLDGGTISISTNLYPGVIHPQGYSPCISFSSTSWPTWTFAFDDRTVSREIFCVRGQSTVVVRWRLQITTTDSIELRVRPKLTSRDYQALHHKNEVLSPEATVTV